jgi:hypothetical protein
MRLLSAIVGTGIGVAVAWGVQRLISRPVTQSIVALLVAWILGSVAAAGLWLAFPPSNIDVLAVSIGISESGMGVIAAVVVALASHALLGWFANWLPGLASNRTLVLGAIGGLWGAAAFASAWGLTRPVG